VTAAEYPDTKWAGPPRAYGTGRDGKAVRLSVIHYTAGAEGRTSAEDGAAYDKRRTDGTSCHVFHDPDSSVQEVLRRDRSNSAFGKGNRLGIHHELTGTVQSRAQWLDAASDAILWRAARAVAKDCQDFGLEPRRLSDAEVRRAWYEFPNGPRGICGHDNITRAFPEDGGTHLDPGAQFPWDVFLERVRGYLGTPSLTSAGDQEMIKVLAIAQGNGQTGFYGWAYGHPLHDIPNGAALENWRGAARFAAGGLEVAGDEAGLDQLKWVMDKLGTGAAVNIPGGEQLAAVVAAAVDSRIDAIARAVNDMGHARSAE
jgi:hypothetical protein